MRRVCSIPAGTLGVEQFVLSPDGGLIAAVNGPDVSPAVRVWTVDGAVEKPPVKQSRSPVSSIAFSPDGGRLAIAGRAGGVRI